MDSINSYSSAILKIIEAYLKDDDSNNVLLEPFSCILKLGLLFYKPMGTKLSITKNSIQFNDATIYQGALRTYTGDSREDLHNLCYPLMIALNWFPKKNEKYKFFYEQCILGLTYLKNNYDRNSLTNHTLSHYIELINSESKDVNIITASPLMNSLKDFWTKEEINIIYLLFTFAVKQNDTDKIFYVNMIEKIIENKEKKLNEFVKEISTKY
tara:strand:- start:330 stop:965 length:636 start_codon:yes stop_codon:yes gene_type:complete